MPYVHSTHYGPIQVRVMNGMPPLKAFALLKHNGPHGMLPQPTLLELDIQHLPQLIDNPDIDLYAAFYAADREGAELMVAPWLSNGFVGNHMSVFVGFTNHNAMPWIKVLPNAVVEEEAIPQGCDICGNAEYCHLFGCVGK